mmetsp:Transcript_25155/g.52108  ORF Transcript_25155/g.52108 Transcript_25155/m.52108 type:complete len:215 (+) Transcript_25155:671-1315(+)
MLYFIMFSKHKSAGKKDVLVEDPSLPTGFGSCFLWFNEYLTRCAEDLSVAMPVLYLNGIPPGVVSSSFSCFLSTSTFPDGPSLLYFSICFNSFFSRFFFSFSSFSIRRCSSSFCRCSSPAFFSSFSRLALSSARPSLDGTHGGTICKTALWLFGMQYIIPFLAMTPPSHFARVLFGWGSFQVVTSTSAVASFFSLSPGFPVLIRSTVSAAKGIA